MSLVVLKNADKARFKQEKWTPGRSIGCIPHPFRAVFLGGVGRGKPNTIKNIFLCHQASPDKFKELYIVSPSTSEEWEDCDPTDTLTDLPGPELFNPKRKTLLIIDDFELTGINTAQKRKLSTLMRYVSSHANVSIMLSFQSFFDVPAIARKCANVFCVWRPASKLETNTIGNRCGLDKGVLDSLFKEHAEGPYDSIMVDRTVGSPAPIRKNVYEKLEL